MSEIQEQIRWLREGVAGGHAIKIADLLEKLSAEIGQARNALKALCDVLEREGFDVAGMLARAGADAMEHTCTFIGGKCKNKATGEIMLRGSDKWYLCCDFHSSLAMREGAKTRELPRSADRLRECEHEWVGSDLNEHCKRCGKDAHVS